MIGRLFFGDDVFRVSWTKSLFYKLAIEISIHLREVYKRLK